MLFRKRKWIFVNFELFVLNCPVQPISSLFIDLFRVFEPISCSIAIRSVLFHITIPPPIVEILSITRGNSYKPQKKSRCLRRRKTPFLNVSAHLRFQHFTFEGGIVIKGGIVIWNRTDWICQARNTRKKIKRVTSLTPDSHRRSWVQNLAIQFHAFSFPDWWGLLRLWWIWAV